MRRPNPATSALMSSLLGPFPSLRREARQLVDDACAKFEVLQDAARELGISDSALRKFRRLSRELPPDKPWARRKRSAGG
jgi:hypothetical protein